MIPRILIIAGSDSGGGAGIQADIKSVTMLGGHAMTAIAAITAQNTLGVTGVHAVPTAMVLAQIDACVADIGTDAVKIGMIGSSETAAAVADRLAALDGVPVVFDPVMIATSGSALADPPTIAAFERLMAGARLITPNAPELAALTGLPVGDHDQLAAAATALARRTGAHVLAKGGHVDGDLVRDILIGPDGGRIDFADPRIETRHMHGTGCTLASAIATGLGAGLSLADAVRRARLFVRLALREAPGLGAGHGPMGHQAVRLDVGPEVRLNQVTVAVSDYAASVAFYRVLGLRLIVDAPPRYARFEAPGGVTLSLSPLPGKGGAGDGSDHRMPESADSLRSPPTPNPSLAERGVEGTTLYFECEDLDDRVARLKAAGIRFDQDPADQSWLWREARLVDPSGNHVCLYRAGEARRYPPWRVA